MTHPDYSSLPGNNNISVLVTGATGLLGSHLVSALAEKGMGVKALFRHTPPFPATNANLQWVQGDIMDPLSLEEAMQGVTHVYHCAAVVSFNPRMRQQMNRINIEGTANVVNAAVACGVQKLCHVSSVAVYGKSNQQVIKESNTLNVEQTGSDYGKSKLLAEMEVWRGVGEGLKAVVVNPSVILGAGDWNQGSTKIFKTAYQEFPWYTEGVTGFVDVLDVVKAMLALMQSDVSGEKFILSAENKTYRHIFSHIAKCFGKRPPHRKVSRLLAGLIRRVEGIKSLFGDKDPLLTRETAEAALTVVEYDGGKIAESIPAFTYNPIDDCIERIAQQLRLKYQLD